MENILNVRNMVCDRCISTVNDILSRNNIPFINVALGEVVLQKSLSAEEAELIDKEFSKVGFEIIADKNEMLVNRIKSIIIKDIYEEESFSNKNLSVLLTEQLHYDYSHLSSIFSHLEGKSIQTFQHTIKVERIKELLEYNEKSISEIADLLGYGSAAYLSTSFKKTTGVTPSQYRINHKNARSTLNSL